MELTITLKLKKHNSNTKRPNHLFFQLLLNQTDRPALVPQIGLCIVQPLEDTVKSILDVLRMQQCHLQLVALPIDNIAQVVVFVLQPLDLALDGSFL